MLLPHVPGAVGRGVAVLDFSALSGPRRLLPRIPAASMRGSSFAAVEAKNSEKTTPPSKG